MVVGQWKLLTFDDDLGGKDVDFWSSPLELLELPYRLNGTQENIKESNIGAILNSSTTRRAHTRSPNKSNLNMNL